MTQNRYMFKRAWECPLPIKEFITSKIKGKCLNLCCGGWPFADVNVDIISSGCNLQGKPIIKADILDPAFNLNERFDTIFVDPPWNWPYHWRAALNQTVSRHLKHNGLFILNAPWPPRAFYFKIKEVYVMFKDAGLPANASLLSIAEYVTKEVNDIE